MRAAIVAISPERVIGIDGELPWHYSADLRRFKRLTMGTTVIMGRRTWESIGSRPLPGRHNIVITKNPLPDIDYYGSLSDALADSEGDVWFIGGAHLYRSALPFCDFIDVTLVPDRVNSPDAVYFPELDPAQWRSEPPQPLAEDPRLSHCRYYRRPTGS